MKISKQQFLGTTRHIIQNKVVLDLACHDGESTGIIINNGAKHVYGVDIRSDLIDKAKNTISGPVEFFVGDITDKDLIGPLVHQSQTVVCLGAFYHLFDHFRWLSHVLKPHIDYCLIETLFGPESLNPEMVWGFEETNNILHGWNDGCQVIPHGTPNLSWIIECARIFDFDCDWLQCYDIPRPKKIKNITLEEYHNIAGPNWPSYQDLITEENQHKIPEFVRDELQQMLKDETFDNKRMILRLYNRSRVESIPIDLEKNYRWPY